MIWTYCPSCSARVDWGPTCSECGARIPAFDAGTVQPGVDPASGARDESKDSSSELGLANRVAMFLIFVGLIAAVALLIRYAITGGSAGGQASDQSQSPESSVVSDNTPPEITAVNVSAVTGTSAIISWDTDEASSSQVEYFDLASYQAGSALDTNLGTAHSVTLDALEPGLTYRFAAWSADASGNRAASGEGLFNTPLPGAGGRQEAGSVYFNGSQVLGTDKQPIRLQNNVDAVDVSREYLMQFLLEDDTDRLPYVDGSFDCSEFAETLHNNAERAGIRAAYVCLSFAGTGSGHAMNAFNTTDAGLVYVDCTGQPVAHSCPLDSTVEVKAGQPYAPQLISPCPYIVGLAPLGTVTDIGLTW